MKAKSRTLPAAIVAVLLWAPVVQPAPNSLTGSIAGLVSSTLGIPQMGATVTLYNRLDRQIARALTDERGIFQFDALPSDVYSLKISLTSFVPAFRSNISVQPGIRRILSINMASVLSSIELVYSLPLTQGLMSDDWKWALRGSLATRPILRVLSSDARDPLRYTRVGTGYFSHTRGVVRLSAGDSPAAPTLGSQPDLGTAFALATSFLGSNKIQLSGNLGYSSQSGNPAAGFRTTFSRKIGDVSTPEFAITMRQLFLTGRAGTALIGGQNASLPAMKTMSFGINDQMQLTENLMVAYGATMESVSFIDRLNYVSPYVKFSYDMDALGMLDFGFSSGIPDAQHYHQQASSEEAHPAGDRPQQELSGVGLFPRVSLRDSHARVQRAQNVEIGLHKTLGSRTFSAGAYREAVNNAALIMAGADGVFANGEMLPDLFSTESIFNAGRYHTMGYMVSMQQKLGENWTVTGAFGNSGVLQVTSDTLQTEDPAELRGLMQARRRHWVNARTSGLLASTGTRFTTSYQFMNGKALTPGHYYMTQSHSPEQGLNVYVRQPIPAIGGRNGKLEATAEVRNILAQGYQQMHTPGGRRFYLVHSPRALRGGLAFIF